MPLEQFLDTAIPIADALVAAHAKGITHRDLTPSNVMVGDDGRVRLLDFGLAKLVEETKDPELTQLPTEVLTEQGVVMGTVPYMSPEQIEGKPVDPRTDIFSLGVLFYEMATGKRPFEGDTSPALMSSILKDTPPQISSRRVDLPRHLDRVIQRCIEKHPDQRLQTARDVLNELTGLRDELRTGLTHETPTKEDDRPSTVRWLWGDEGLELLKKATELDPEALVLQVLLARQYAAIGRNDEAQEILDRLETESQRQYVSPFFLAWIHTYLGNRDEALAYLDQAVNSHAAYTLGSIVIPTSTPCGLIPGSRTFCAA